jgi:hypothetical protein
VSQSAHATSFPCIPFYLCRTPKTQKSVYITLFLNFCSELILAQNFSTWVTRHIHKNSQTVESYCHPCDWLKLLKVLIVFITFSCLYGNIQFSRLRVIDNMWVSSLPCCVVRILSSITVYWISLRSATSSCFRFLILRKGSGSCWRHTNCQNIPEVIVYYLSCFAEGWHDSWWWLGRLLMTLLALSLASFAIPAFIHPIIVWIENNKEISVCTDLKRHNQ